MAALASCVTSSRCLHGTVSNAAPCTKAPPAAPPAAPPPPRPHGPPTPRQGCRRAAAFAQAPRWSLGLGPCASQPFPLPVCVSPRSSNARSVCHTPIPDRWLWQPWKSILSHLHPEPHQHPEPPPTGYLFQDAFIGWGSSFMENKRPNSAFTGCPRQPAAPPHGPHVGAARPARPAPRPREGTPAPPAVIKWRRSVSPPRGGRRLLVGAGECTREGGGVHSGVGRRRQLLVLKRGAAP
jgi:hypothetical protein